MVIGDVELVLGGDIILEAFGISVADENAHVEIRDSINSLNDGDEMTVKVLRGGEVVELKNFFFDEILVPTPPGEKASKKKRK